MLGGPFFVNTVVLQQCDSADGRFAKGSETWQTTTARTMSVAVGPIERAAPPDVRPAPVVALIAVRARLVGAMLNASHM